ncbi:hypothetical protein EVAR_6445_1 [Eumeta japonica]|uniref:Uncharacterized protein n=1 Tax=Eumeta variegata TaxID=151549 RepID=A0A4C1SQJ1_EUMVA|nr:hypothetical protein EVAR_6445_1 [Eumeta japonica]
MTEIAIEFAHVRAGERYRHHTERVEAQNKREVKKVRTPRSPDITMAHFLRKTSAGRRRKPDRGHKSASSATKSITERRTAQKPIIAEIRRR